MDVERDWGGPGLRGVDEVLPRLLELLDRHAARATFFVVGELAERVGRHLDPDGPHEVGSHGLTHALLTRLDGRDIEREIVGSKARLEAAGYEVLGFRAPFLRRPPGLVARLGRAGYRYDASAGSILPSPFNGRSPRVRTVAWPQGARLQEWSAASLRPGWVPCNLTWLRWLDPLGRRLLPTHPCQFSLHLHELLEGPGGWAGLARPLRRLHGRACGPRAWALLEGMLARHAFGPIRDALGPRGTGAP